MTTFAAPPVQFVTGNYLHANLAVIAERQPKLAERIMRAEPRHDLVFASTEQGALTAEMDGVTLASRRRPLDEASRLAEGFDIQKAGGLLILGFGLGHHVSAAAQRLRRMGLVVVFEPDLGLLRAVLERMDHSAWMRAFPFLIFTDASDSAAISQATQGYEAPLSVGVEILDHPPSRKRLGDSGVRFVEAFTTVVAAMRTHVITTMMQTDITVRNVMMNADVYVTSPGINELAGIAMGRAAVVVSAGPSLKRTIDELARPGVRDRCVIIAVQTVLKQLLERGIKPHFVTALDYHEISKRFYEGLSTEDVKGVTLVAEPRVNPAVIEAWPGDLRLCGEQWLDETLSLDLAGVHTRLKPGATVAHLAYYLARHLGCDPVILTGQDLAFTDGQYYSSGAAIHKVWANELNAFNTLEMMEWQRIVRMRGHLNRVTDHLGRGVYTDDQMATYLAQFERDFAVDVGAGQAVIDATEGGVRKAHTQAMNMREALDRFVFERSPRLSAIPPAPRKRDKERLRKLSEELRAVRSGVRRVARLSRETSDLLRKTERHHGDEQKVNRIIKEIYALRDEVQVIQPGYMLVHKINQTGAFKRYKADRVMALADGLSALEKQRKQIERDITNVRWLADAADTLDELLEAAAAGAEGSAPKITRDPAPQLDDESSDVRVTREAIRTAAIIPVDLDHAALGVGATPGTEFRGAPAIKWTLERLSRCATLDRVLLASDQPERVRAIVGNSVNGKTIEVVGNIDGAIAQRRRGIAGARLWSTTCWRGGLSYATCFDEVFDAPLVSRLLINENLGAALVVGADWCMVDPALCDALIARHAENPQGNPITFTQAPPGLTGCVIGRAFADELNKGWEQNLTLAGIGGVLGYIPTLARHDPIAKSLCVLVEPGVRDVMARFIPDLHSSRALLEQMIQSFGDRWIDADATTLATAMRQAMESGESIQPREITLELARNASAVDIERVLTPMVAKAHGDLVVTLVGEQDVLERPDWRACVDAVRRAGVAALHVRTTLRVGQDVLDAVLESPIDVLSVDMFAFARDTYVQLTGIDAQDQIVANVRQLLERRKFAGGWPTQWIVPRITRRDAVYGEIEAFFDVWTMLAGCCVIDPLPTAVIGERIEPITMPASVEAHGARTRRAIRVDGAGR